MKDLLQYIATKETLALRRGDLVEAEKFYRKPLELKYTRKEKIFKVDKQNFARAYNNLGNVELTRGDIKRASKLLNKSLRLFKDIEVTEGLAANYNNLGNIEEINGNLKEAEQLYKKSLELYKILDEKEKLAAVYKNLGDIALVSDKVGEAVELQSKSLELYEALGSKWGIATASNSLGNIARTQGDLGKAMQLFQKSLKLFEDLNDKHGIATARRNLNKIKQSHYKKRATKQPSSPLVLEEILKSEQGKIGALYLNAQTIFDKNLSVAKPKQKQKLEVPFIEENTSTNIEIGQFIKVRRDKKKLVSYGEEGNSKNSPKKKGWNWWSILKWCIGTLGAGILAWLLLIEKFFGD